MSRPMRGVNRWARRTTSAPAANRSPAGPTHVPYVKALDGVRAASILLVLAAHMLPLGPTSLELNDVAGKMGMSLFFCLSGYLIVSIIYRNPDVVSFLTRRILRIVPAAVLYLLVVLVIVGVSLDTILSNLAFVTNYWNIGLDGPLPHMWSLSVEMHFYMAIALATLLLGRRAVWLIPIAAIAITLIRVDAGVYTNIRTHLRVDEILSGGCLALLAMHRGDRLRQLLRDDRVAAGAILALGVGWGFACHDLGGWLNYLRPYLAAALVGAVMHCGWRPLLDILEGSIAASIARISYALYLYHMLMIWGWFDEGTSTERYLIRRPISLALTFAAAYASTDLWERRWQDLAKRLTENRTAAAH